MNSSRLFIPGSGPLVWKSYLRRSAPLAAISLVSPCKLFGTLLLINLYLFKHLPASCQAFSIFNALNTQTVLSIVFHDWNCCDRSNFPRLSRFTSVDRRTAYLLDIAGRLECCLRTCNRGKSIPALFLLIEVSGKRYRTNGNISESFLDSLRLRLGYRSKLAVPPSSAQVISDPRYNGFLCGRSPSTFIRRRSTRLQFIDPTYLNSLLCQFYAMEKKL